MRPAPASRRRLEGLAVGVAGRHELYVASLAAVVSSLGAEVRVLPGPPAAIEASALEQFEVLLLESPLDSDLALLGEGPPVLVLEDRSAIEHRPPAARSIAGVLEKNASLAQLSLAIRDALERRSTEEAGQLTGRQREVLELLVEGLDNGEIADRLGISRRTARAHVSALLERLGVENRVQAAVTAVRQGWAAPVPSSDSADDAPSRS